MGLQRVQVCDRCGDERKVNGDSEAVLNANGWTAFDLDRSRPVMLCPDCKFQVHQFIKSGKDAILLTSNFTENGYKCYRLPFGGILRIKEGGGGGSVEGSKKS